MGKKKRRIYENLSMALASLQIADQSLMQAETLTQDNSEEQDHIRALCRQSKQIINILTEEIQEWKEH